METFAELKELVGNPHYQVQRHKNLSNLTDGMIDLPIIDLINKFNRLPYCFTLQSCYGHFVYNGQKDPQNFERLMVKDTLAKVEYRIAYIKVIFVLACLAVALLLLRSQRQQHPDQKEKDLRAAFPWLYYSGLGVSTLLTLRPFFSKWSSKNIAFWYHKRLERLLGADI